MATTKDINMLVCIDGNNIPKAIITAIEIVLFTKNKHNNLTTGYHHPCGNPVIEFYKDADKPEDCHKAENLYYIRYCNQIKDYENRFEDWLESLAPYIIQTDGHHLGTMYTDNNRKMYLICLVDGKIVYQQLEEGEVVDRACTK